MGPRDAEVKTRGQRPTDAIAESQRSEGEIDPESKSGDPKLVGSGLELEDK